MRTNKFLIAGSLGAFLLSTPLALAQVGGGEEMPSNAKTGTSDASGTKSGGGMMMKKSMKKKKMKHHKHM